MAIRITNNNYGGRVSISSRGLGGRFNYGVDPPPLLLDLYPNAAAAYSLRKLKKTYTGSAIRVRRSNDNAEQNIGFVNNVLDTASLLTFTGANSGFVTTWYDQSGNSRNATQTVSANQPTIVALGVLQTLNSKPAVFFIRNNSTKLTLSGILSGSQSRTQLVVYKATVINQIMGIFGQGSSGGPGSYSFIQSRNGAVPGDPYFAGYSADLGANLTTQDTNLKIGTFLYNGTVGYLWKNNTQITSGNLTLNTGIGELFQIGNSTSTELFDGYIPECILWSTNELSNISAINSNINSYYTIY